MPIIALVLSSISIILSIIVLFVFVPIMVSILQSNTKSNDLSDNHSLTSKEKMEYFKDVQDHFLSLMTLGLFDMGENLEILHFEEELNTLALRMDKLLSDSEFRDSVNNKYMEYLKNNYPYLFHLAVRINPFNPDATPIVE